MSRDQLVVLAPDKRKHSEKLFDLLPKVFHHLGYYTGRDWCRNTYINNSQYDWTVSRIGVIGDAIVSHFGVWDYQMRIGTACVRVGGIGAVATDGDHRKKGLMDVTARAAVEAMREQGYDMTILFGIDNFYHRFGYVRGWSDTNFFVNTADLPAEAPVGTLRKCPTTVRKDLADLYNRYYATTTGVAVRPTYTKAGYTADKSIIGALWIDAQGTPAGYVYCRPQGNRLSCPEYCGDATQALRIVAQLARRLHCGEVVFETLPDQSDMAKLLRRGNCRTETYYRRSGGAMIHLLNLPSALAKMTGELTRRLQTSPLAAWHGNLLLASAQEQAMLAIADGQVQVAPVDNTPHSIRGGEALVQLLIGTTAPDETAEAGQMQLTGDAEKLLHVLFSAQYPQLSLFDRY